MKKPLSGYQSMTSILKPNVKPNSEEIQSINSYFFCSWLSNNRNTIPISAVLNRYYNAPISAQFKFANDYSELSGMANRVKFIGFDTKKDHPDLEKLLGNISRFYNTSKERSMEYFQMMDEPTAQKFFTMYDTGRK